MNVLRLRWPVIAFVIGLLAVLSFGCAVIPGGGYGYGGGNYYEPYGSSYGGWGTGYRVGPYRGGGHSMPSIPSGSRSGGWHGR